MNTSVDYYTLQRLAAYIKGAVSQGAFLPFEELVKRFKKTTKLSLGGRRQKQRYLSALKKLGNNLGFQCIMAPGRRGHLLYITSESNSHFSSDYARETPYAQALLKGLQTAKVTSIKVYDTLLANTELTKKSLEKLISILKTKAKQFGLVFFKVGRELYAKLIYQYVTENNSKNLQKNTPQNYDITSSIVAKDKEILRNTPNGGIRFFKEDRINAKAHWLSKRLRSLFWDNCKVKCCMPMLFNFVKNALQDGFEDKVIEAKFDRALVVRHADATDMGLNMGSLSFKFEMSSTVSLANEYLRENENATVCERWYNLIKNTLSKRIETEDIRLSPKSEKPSMWSWTKKVFQPNESENDDVPYPTQKIVSFNKCLKNNKMLKSHTEKMEEFLLSNGYNNRDIQIFQSFQKKLMPDEQIQIYAIKIVKMGLLLAEGFSDRTEYNDFKKDRYLGLCP